MKKLIYTLAASLLAFGCLAQKKTGYEHMTPPLWLEDLEYLGNKIGKEFNSFDPNVKDNFATELKQVTEKLTQLRNYQVPGEIQRLLSLLGDGHTELNIGHKTVKYHRLPLSLHIFENEFYVLAAHERYAHLIGGKVKRIGGMSISEAFTRLKSNMSRDNEIEYQYAGPGYIILTEILAYLGIEEAPLSSSFTIETADGKLVTETLNGLNAESYSKGPWQTLAAREDIGTLHYQSRRDESYWYEYLPESKTLYFHLSRTNNQKGRPNIRSFSKELFGEIDKLRPEKLVIDLRLNNGGNYNLTKPLWQGIQSREWLNQKGKVWAITGRRTFSAAATFCIFLKQHTQAQLIGEVCRTHPNKADNNEYMTLPNSGFLIEYTTRIKAHWPEKPYADRIPVDVEIVPTYEAYKAGRDLVMEYLLSKN